MTPEQSKEWCRRQLEMMAEGGTWGIPRSGLVFQRRGNGFVLTSVMPHDRRMLVTKDELLQIQVDEFDANVEHFAAAGIEVTDPNRLLPTFEERPSSDYRGK